MKKILGAIFLVWMSFTGIAQELSLDTDNATVSFVFVEENLEGTVDVKDASLQINLSDLSGSKISGTGSVSSLSTGNKTRDKHLKSKDYFDAENYPDMKFYTTSIKKMGDAYEATGNLTIKGVTQEVTFTMDSTANDLVLKGRINADDFGVSPKKHDKSNVDITITVPLQ